MRGRFIACVVFAGVVLPLAAASAGQASRHEHPASAPKATSAAPAKPWTVPRTPWGDPDLQGLWPSLDMLGTPYERPPELAVRTVLNDEEFAARAAARQRQAEVDSEEFIQNGGYVVIRSEMIHETRSIPLGDRSHIGANIRQYMGDSRGHVECDTRVIESTNFNGKVGLTLNGNSNLTSQSLRIVERLT